MLLHHWNTVLIIPKIYVNLHNLLNRNQCNMIELEEVRIKRNQKRCLKWHTFIKAKEKVQWLMQNFVKDSNSTNIHINTMQNI